MDKIVALQCFFPYIFIVVKQERPRMAESGRVISQALCGTVDGVAHFPPNINSGRTSLWLMNKPLPLNLSWNCVSFQNYLQYSHVIMSLAAEAFVSQIAGNVFTFLGVFIIVCKASLNQLILKYLFPVLHVYEMQRYGHYLLTSQDLTSYCCFHYFLFMICSG